MIDVMMICRLATSGVRAVSRLFAVSVLAAGTSAHSVAAEEAADFYKGRTVSIVVGHETGTGYDIYARTFAKHLGRHIPGMPNVVVQNMVGASGLVAANWLYNIAPKDGTVLATFVHTAIFEPLAGNTAAKFDPAKFTWVGNLDEGVGICGVSKAAGIGKFEDLLVKETIFGATGASGPLGKYAVAVKNLLGAKIRLVAGYQGSASVKLAIQRGEVNGICGLSWSTVTSYWKDDLETGAFKPILQLSGSPRPELLDLPHVASFAKTLPDQQLFALIFGAQALGRIFVSPPAMPPERKASLRAAFLATAKDPQFLADAAKVQIDIASNTGEEVEGFIAHVAGASPAVLDRARKAVRND
jgi:tripartite-type tricarboxylate transporter receptor subunit TctC